MCSNDFRKSMDLITRQFFCACPLQSIKWDNTLNDWNLQEELINNTYKHERNVVYPLKLSYQVAFLKWMINNVENCGDEVNDCVYNSVAECISKVFDSVNSYKHYLTECSVISLCESVQIISEGTTGLSTWQAALALSEWCVANKSFFKDKTILELGSGVGLVGISLAINCQPTHVVLSDCHDKVLNLLRQNIQLNLKLLEQSGAELLPQTDCIVKGRVRHSATGGLSEISVVEHYWGENDEELVGRVGADIILAADVVYDSSLFPALITCINACLQRRTKSGTQPELVLVCTQRNSTTLDEFLKLLSESCAIKEGTLPNPKWFVWSTETPIKLFNVTIK